MFSLYNVHNVCILVFPTITTVIISTRCSMSHLSEIMNSSGSSKLILLFFQICKLSFWSSWISAHVELLTHWYWRPPPSAPRGLFIVPGFFLLERRKTYFPFKYSAHAVCLNDLTSHSWVVLPSRQISGASDLKTGTMTSINKFK